MEFIMNRNFLLMFSLFLSINTFSQAADDSVPESKGFVPETPGLLGQPDDCLWSILDFLPTSSLTETQNTCNQLSERTHNVIVLKYKQFRQDERIGELFNFSVLEQSKFVQLLLNSFDDINAQDKFGDTALTKLCMVDNIDIIGLLLNHGANPNIKDGNEDTPLMKASMSNHVDIVKLLLSHDADINLQNNYLETALMQACAFDSVDVVVLLLDRGADINLQDQHGQTALAIALTHGNRLIAQMLLEHSRR
jgi:ankyrin repeat protein